MVLVRDIREGTIVTHNGKPYGFVKRVWDEDHIRYAIIQNDWGTEDRWACGLDLQELPNWYQEGEEILEIKDHPEQCELCKLIERLRNESPRS